MTLRLEAARPNIPLKTYENTLYFSYCILSLLFIQVLFKNLGIDMKTVKPTSFLKDREREVEGNPDFSNKDVVASQTQTISEINTGIVPALNRVDLPPEIVCSSHPHPGGQLNLLSQVCYP